MVLDLQSQCIFPVSSICYTGHTAWTFMRLHFWPMLLP